MASTTRPLSSLVRRCNSARDMRDELDQAQCLNNIGSAYCNKGEYQDALTYFQQAYEIRDRLKLMTQSNPCTIWRRRT